MRAIILAMVAACGTDYRPDLPDAGAPDAAADCAAPADAAVDSPPDAPACWQVRYYQCESVIYEICVPEHGCSEVFYCMGNPMAYCSP